MVGTKKAPRTAIRSEMAVRGVPCSERLTGSLG